MAIVFEVLIWILATLVAVSIFAHIMASLTVMEYVREGKQVSFFTVPLSILSPDSVEPEGQIYRKICLYSIATAFGGAFLMFTVIVFATKVVGIEFK